MRHRLKATLLVFVLGILSCSHAGDQSRESWLPDAWPNPTLTPQLGSDRVLLYRPDSARTAQLALATHLTHHGFLMQEVTARHLQTQGRRRPDSLHFHGGADVDLLTTTLQVFPAILLVRSTGTPNLRRLKRLSGVSRAHPNGHGHKIRYPSVVGQGGDGPNPLTQVLFDRMAALLRSYPADRLMYLNRDN